jgi:hypothetical protein
MRERGQRSNREAEIEVLIDVLIDPAGRRQRADLGAASAAASGRPVPTLRKLRLQQGLIQKTVFSVLDQANKPLRVTEIRGLVEQRLGRSVSRDTVNSCLSVAARDSRQRVRRCGLGVYAAVT